MVSPTKKSVAIFFALETVLLVINFQKNFETRGGWGSFPIQKILTSSGTSAEKVMGATGFDCPVIFWARSAQLFGS